MGQEPRTKHCGHEEYSRATRAGRCKFYQRARVSSIVAAAPCGRAKYRRDKREQYEAGRTDISDIMTRGPLYASSVHLSGSIIVCLIVFSHSFFLPSPSLLIPSFYENQTLLSVVFLIASQCSWGLFGWLSVSLCVSRTRVQYQHEDGHGHLRQNASVYPC